MANCIIADDSKIMRMLLSKIMNNFGYDVTEAENGDELLSSYTSNALTNNATTLKGLFVKEIFSLSTQM